MASFVSIDLTTWDYLVIDCGYVDRFLSKATEIIERIGGGDAEDENDPSRREHSLVFFLDGNDDKTEFQPDVDGVYQTLVHLQSKNKIDIRGCLCFCNSDYFEDDIVKVLRSYKHCAGFGREPYILASFKTKTGKTVLYKCFDTESG